MKREIKIPGFKLDKAGKPVRDDTKLDLITRLKKKAAPRRKFVGVKPSDREFRG